MISPRRAVATVSLALLTGAALLVAPAASAAVASATDAPASVVSVDSGSSTRDLTLATSGIVDDVTVTVDFAVASSVCGDESDGLTTFNYDVELRLVSPSGTTVTLVRSTGSDSGSTYGTGPSARVQVTFDDDAAAAVGSTGATPVSGTFRPVESLTAFDGESAAGTWTVAVVDTVGGSPSCYYGATLNVDVLEVPILADATLADATLGDPYSESLSLVANSLPADSFEVTDGTLPAGVSLDDNGVIAGQPTESGDFTFSVEATNAHGTGPAVEYELRVGAPAALSGPGAATAQAGESFSYEPTFDAGFPAASATLSDGALPDGLSLNAATGEISGAITDALGEYPVTLTADSGYGSPATLSVIISLVAGPVDAITLDPVTAAIDEGDSVTYTVTAQDSSGNDVTLEDGDVVLTSDVASDVVDGLTVTFPESATTHTITAMHTASGATATSTVDVEPLVPATLTGPDAATVTAGEELTYTPAFEPGYPAATEVTVASGDLPEGLTLDPATGEIAGTSTVAGEYALTLSADNGVGDPATLDVTLTVTAAEVDAFTITPSATSVNQGGTVTISAQGSDEFGNDVDIAPGQVTLSSDVSTDVIDGMSVTFPSASPHTLTATYTATGATASVVIEVQPAPVEDDVADADGDGLAATGVNPATIAQAAAASALALLGGGLLVARRRVVRS